MFKDIGIDLGTANTLVYMRVRVLLFVSLQLLLLMQEQKSSLCWAEAKDVIGRTPGSVLL